MANTFGVIVNAVIFVIGVIIFCGFFYRAICDRFGSERSEPAIVSGKNSFERRVLMKSAAPYSEKKYVVAFELEGRDASFFVNEQTYNSLNKGDKGLLIFKGTRFVDFV